METLLMVLVVSKSVKENSKKIQMKLSTRPLQIKRILVSFLFLNTVCPGNKTRTQSNLVRKQTLNNLTKMTSLRLVWLYGWVFLYKPSSCEFESRWSHLSYWDVVPVLGKEVSGNFSDLPVKIDNIQWPTSVEAGCHLGDSPKLAIGQKNIR